MKNLKASKHFLRRFVHTILLNYDTGLNGISWKNLIGTKNDLDILLENPKFVFEVENIMEKIVMSEDKSMLTTLKNQFKLKYYDGLLNDEQTTILQERCDGGLKGVKLEDNEKKYHGIHPLKEYDVEV